MISLALDGLGVGLRDRIAGGRRDQHIHRHGHQVGVGDHLLGKAGHAAAVVVGVLAEFVDIQTLGVVRPAGQVGDSHDLGAHLGQERGGVAADVAEALDRAGDLVDMLL